MKKFCIILLAVLTGCVSITDGGNTDGNNGSGNNSSGNNNTGTKQTGSQMTGTTTGTTTTGTTTTGTTNGNNTSGPNVDENRKAVDFTTEERESFCEWVETNSAAAAGVYTCVYFEVTFEEISIAECGDILDDSAQCQAKAFESCFDSFFEDPCLYVAEVNPACDAFAACSEDTTKGAPGEPCTMNGECEEGCFIENNIGYCTVACDSSADCPDFWSCTDLGDDGSFCLQ